MTGDEELRRASKRAFDYERSWFDVRTGNWPDLRGVARAADRYPHPPAAASWCNGGPGIALSRLRAAKLLGCTELARDADLALALCERRAVDGLGRAPDDFSLCHGTAGVAEALLLAAPGRGDEFAELAGQVGEHGIELYGGRGATAFPCGVPSGVTAGLLLGLSGIGMLYLRLCDRRVASPLLIHRSDA